jgi:hypothetical protein
MGGARPFTHTPGLESVRRGSIKGRARPLAHTPEFESVRHGLIMGGTRPFTHTPELESVRRGPTNGRAGRLLTPHSLNPSDEGQSREELDRLPTPELESIRRGPIKGRARPLAHTPELEPVRRGPIMGGARHTPELESVRRGPVIALAGTSHPPRMVPSQLVRTGLTMHCRIQDYQQGRTWARRAALLCLLCLTQDCQRAVCRVRQSGR